MSEQPYEIELVEFDPDSLYACERHLVTYATLTGLDRDEIWQRWPEALRKDGGWGGRKHVEAALALGFNTNPKFKKFDPETPWPCILRVQVPKHWGWKGCWWRLIYHQGQVYNPTSADSDPNCSGWSMLSIKEFEARYKMCRITSMLQVWMSITNKLT